MHTACLIAPLHLPSAPHQTTSVVFFKALQDSVILGKKLAAGGFGTVYRGDLIEENGDETEVVIKKVIELFPGLVDISVLGESPLEMPAFLQHYALLEMLYIPLGPKWIHLT